MGTTRVFRVETKTHWVEWSDDVEFFEAREEEDEFLIQAFNGFHAESKAVEALRFMYPKAYANGKFTVTAFLDNPRDLEREEETDEEQWRGMTVGLEAQVEKRFLSPGFSLQGNLDGTMIALATDTYPEIHVRVWGSKIEFLES